MICSCSEDTTAANSTSNHCLTVTHFKREDCDRLQQSMGVGRSSSSSICEWLALIIVQQVERSRVTAAALCVSGWY